MLPANRTSMFSDGPALAVAPAYVTGAVVASGRTVTPGT